MVFISANTTTLKMPAKFRSFFKRHLQFIDDGHCFQCILRCCYSIICRCHNKEGVFLRCCRHLVLQPQVFLGLVFDFVVNNIHPSTLLRQCSRRAAKTKHSSPISGLYESIWKRHWNKQIVRVTRVSPSLFLSLPLCWKCLPDLVVSVTGPLLVS